MSGDRNKEERLSSVIPIYDINMINWSRSTSNRNNDGTGMSLSSFVCNICFVRLNDLKFSSSYSSYYPLNSSHTSAALPALPNRQQTRLTRMHMWGTWPRGRPVHLEGKSVNSWTAAERFYPPGHFCWTVKAPRVHCSFSLTEDVFFLVNWYLQPPLLQINV